ncbi:MAG: hypothetical protein WA798_09155 [Candidatus Acidiferrum sp.]
MLIAMMSVTSLLGPANSGAQDLDRLRYIPPPQEIFQFFQGNLGPNDGGALALYYARYLHMMGEKPLAETPGPQGTQVYRLLVVTRPYNIPVVVRLSIFPDGTGEIVGKISQSSRFADRLTANKTTRVSHADVEQFLKLLADLGFWSLPVLERIDTARVGLGGVGWMLEGEKAGTYHVVCRDDANLAALMRPVLFLVNLSQLDLASTTARPSNIN